MTPQAAFESLNRTAGLAPLAAPRFEGVENIVPSRFRVATAMAAALGFGGAAAAEIWRFRGGDKQTVWIDLRAAAAASAPQDVARRNGSSLPLIREPTTGFYQSADARWLFLHGGSPFLAQRTLELLNAKNDAASVMQAVAKWNGKALEDALAFLKLTGALVRSEEEWKMSVAGRVLGAPIVLKKVGEGPPGRIEESAAPLGDCRVLDLTRVIAGPSCSRLLAEYGAEVLSVGTAELPDSDLAFAAGKRRTLLDLAKPGDAEALRRLARHADIFVESCRPGGLAGLGFSPASLTHLAPGIITVSISAYGGEGPWAGRRGWEEVTQAATGLAAEQGTFVAARRKEPAQPELVPGAVCDTLTGALAAAGALAAMLRRIREGGSWQVQVSLAATALWLQSLGRIDAEAVPEAWEPRDGLDQYLQSCETKDGWFEFLGPVVRLSKTPPLKGLPPGTIDLPNWASEKANAAEIQSAQT